MIHPPKKFFKPLRPSGRSGKVSKMTTYQSCLIHNTTEAGAADAGYVVVYAGAAAVDAQGAGPGVAHRSAPVVTVAAHGDERANAVAHTGRDKF